MKFAKNAFKNLEIEGGTTNLIVSYYEIDKKNYFDYFMKNQIPS
jgi:hypothetical protein